MFHGHAQWMFLIRRISAVKGHVQSAYLHESASRPGLHSYFSGIGLTRGVYREQVSGNGAKSSKFVSLKVVKKWGERRWRLFAAFT